MQSPDVWTVQRILNWSTPWLGENCQDRPLTSPRLETEILLAESLGFDRMKLYLNLDRPLTQEERDQFKRMLRRRADGEPLAYIVGYRDFFRHRFRVGPGVLIPRPETELLVEECLKLKPSLPPAAEVLDIGTGSGCIAISLAVASPEWTVTGCDIADTPLSLAKENAQKLNALNAEFKQCDILSDDVGEASFDLVVSNPPYICDHEKNIMSFSTLKHEPPEALFGRGAEGLGFYEAIIKKSLNGLLKPGGVLAFECGYQQGPVLSSMLQDSGFKSVTLVNDLAGHGRVVIGGL